MILKNINLINFRNFENLNINFNCNLNIIYGNNGQGKTNLLESIYFLSLTKSHRSFIDTNLIKENKNYSLISGTISKDKFPTKYSIELSGKKKTLKKDENEIKRKSDYLSNINIIIFYPEDLDLIKGGPQERRKYLNIQLSQLNYAYLKIYNEYEKILKARNDILKKIQKKEPYDSIYFDIITNQLIELATKIYIYRKNYIDNINKNCDSIYYDISKLYNFKIIYVNNLENVLYEENPIKEYLKEKYKTRFMIESKAGITLYGPHRDDFEFRVGNHNLKLFGSQGQQRMAVIALKLSEIPIFKTYKGYYPILLLDDVFSELDFNKKTNLLKYITNNIQTFITTTEIDNIDEKILNNAKLIKIDKGTIEEEV